MELIPTVPLLAKREGNHVIVELQNDLQLRLTVHQALRLATGAKREASAIVEEARHVDPPMGQLIAFPSKLSSLVKREKRIKRILEDARAVVEARRART